MNAINAQVVKNSGMSTYVRHHRAKNCGCQNTLDTNGLTPTVVYWKYHPCMDFSARCNIYILRLCYDVSVRLSVCDGSALAYYS